VGSLERDAQNRQGDDSIICLFSFKDCSLLNSYRNAFVFDTLSGSFRKLPPVPEGRYVAGVAVVERRVHVFGGVGRGVYVAMLLFNVAV
jgi:hypothetical protein